MDYNGRPEFVIDAACFPEPGFIHHKNGSTTAGMSRVMMLGVLYAGPQTTATGQIAVKTVPTAMQPIP